MGWQDNLRLATGTAISWWSWFLSHDFHPHITLIFGLGEAELGRYTGPQSLPSKGGHHKWNHLPYNLPSSPRSLDRLAREPPCGD